LVVGLMLVYVLICWVVVYLVIYDFVDVFENEVVFMDFIGVSVDYCSVVEVFVVKE